MVALSSLVWNFISDHYYFIGIFLSYKVLQQSLPMKQLLPMPKIMISYRSLAKRRKKSQQIHFQIYNIAYGIIIIGIEQLLLSLLQFVYDINDGWTVLSINFGYGGQINVQAFAHTLFMSCNLVIIVYVVS